MDWLRWKQDGPRWLVRYRYVILTLVGGIFLMTLPEKKPQETVSVPQAAPVSLEQRLEALLCRVEGAGRVQVLLTEASGEKTLYQTNEDSGKSQASQDRRSTTVLVTDGTRQQTGLVVQVIPPVYQGAVVLCQGGSDPRVRLAVVEAVMSLTGLRSDKITVLKMK